MRQWLRSKICAPLYQNPTVLKDWLIFLEDVARVESSIHLKHKSFSQPTRTPTPAKEKSAESTTNQNYARKTWRGNHTRGNFQGKSRGYSSHQGGRSPILAPHLAVQTIATLSLCRAIVKTVVTDVENEDTLVTNALILCQKTGCHWKCLYANNW